MSASTIAVTGASGHLGRLAIGALLARDVPAGDIVAAVRDPEKVADLAARGVQVCPADYTQPATLDRAFAGIEKLLLVSSNEVGQRVPHHANVVNAARRAGVGLLVYTSILNADASTMRLADDHKATEQVIRDSGVPFVFLRNGWYIENYTDHLAQTLQHGAVLGSAGDGRVSAAARADYAAAAATVLTQSRQKNEVYELGGESFTLAELAREIAEQSGSEVVYHDLPADGYAQALIGAGVPEPFARILADADQGIGRGELFTERDDLSRLIERPPTTLADAVRSALGRLRTADSARAASDGAL